ncbi:hypothetical protein QN277_005644 [Acacia crassicarpa]|uniref:Uncharacterized protein n=1 Tax=Acacia crassicarpa TaxID=499986 RepID=A0AAE1MBS9_9FABA|nr:hypothetical protein QN277_005644 [Acacia crassicarpa]
MATQLTTCFPCRNFTHLSCNHSNAVRFPLPSHPFLTASLSNATASQHKKQHIKKTSHGPPPTEGDLHPSEDEDSELRKVSLDGIPNLNKEVLDTNIDTDSDSSEPIEYIDVENLNNSAVLAEPAPLGIIDVAEQAQQLPGSQVKDLLGLIKKCRKKHPSNKSSQSSCNWRP